MCVKVAHEFIPGHGAVWAVGARVVPLPPVVTKVAFKTRGGAKGTAAESTYIPHQHCQSALQWEEELASAFCGGAVRGVACVCELRRQGEASTPRQVYECFLYVLNTTYALSFDSNILFFINSNFKYTFFPSTSCAVRRSGKRQPQDKCTSVSCTFSIPNILN